MDGAKPGTTSVPVPLRSRLLHRAVGLASLAFRGSWGRIEPLSGPPPERLTLPAGDVTLSGLRWPGPCAGGPAAPLLLLHGLNNNAWIWARVADRLQDEREVVALSLRGHGRSSAPAHGYALDATTADVCAALDGLRPPGGGGPVILAGHSWGGKVACHLAARHPGRVAALILADPVLPQGLNRLLVRFPGLVLAAFEAERGPFGSLQELEAGARRLLYLQRGDEPDRRLWGESFCAQPDGSYLHHLPDSAFREIVLQALAEDITPLLGAIRCPVLLLRPTFTVSFLPGELAGLRRALPQLVERRVSGDHSFIHTNPLDTTREMREFLAAR